MKILADTHVHVYPEYRLGRVWTSAARALRQAGGEGSGPCLPMLFLAESRSSRAWETRIRPAAGECDGWRFSPSCEPEAGILKHAKEGDMWVFAGRQVVTEERLEVLALTLAGDLEDGLPVDATIEAILRRNALPVLSWSPGKWLGRRGRCVDGLLRRTPPDRLFIGDVSLRPRGLPEPAHLRKARAAGFRILAGSDPLPPAGEETQAGRFAVRMEAPFDPQNPATSMRAAFRDGTLSIECVGRRNGLFEAAWRMIRHRANRRK